MLSRRDNIPFQFFNIPGSGNIRKFSFSSPFHATSTSVLPTTDNLYSKNE